MNFKPLPEPPILPPMSHLDAIQILADLERGLCTSSNPDVKEALRMAKVALITERLLLERI